MQDAWCDKNVDVYCNKHQSVNSNLEKLWSPSDYSSEQQRFQIFLSSFLPLRYIIQYSIDIYIYIGFASLFGLTMQFYNIL
jgi:hypothetical protein